MVSDAVTLAAPTRRPTGDASTRVALIRPNTIVFPKSFSWYGPVPPIGLAYIAAVLRDAGHTVDVVDSAGEGIDQIVDRPSPIGTLRQCGISVAEIVDRLHPDTKMVGITHMFLHEWPHVREIAEAVRDRFPDVLIVCGGENATGYWKWMFEQTDAIDACVLGEGERTVVELADRVARGIPLDGGFEGLVLRNGGEACDGGLATRINTKALPDVPRPAWDLFPLDQYFRFADSFGVNRGRSMPVLATRGCPYKCSFCSSPQMWTTRYVVREPEEVAEEIAGYVERYGVRNVNFADLTAITKRQWTLRFCDALEAKAPGLIWQLPVGTRAEALDAEVLQRLWDTGCRNITYAPEAGGERMLDIYDKRVSLDTILNSLRAAKQIGLVTKINIIIGHPQERWPDLLKSFRFMLRAARAGANDAAVMIFGPYPGSKDFKALVEAGTLEVTEEYPYTALSWSSGKHQSYNPVMSTRKLRIAQLTMLMAFYGVANVLRPKRMLAYFRAWRGKSEEATQLDALLRQRRKGLGSGGTGAAQRDFEPSAA
ncbi:MAG: B12-binding domain-containing radical SAM protein [Acidimicrobiales bacterium]|nr:B12-binding domain-containing radical SAM protein [Acidimicrobiales bacterium]MCB9373277.1 B12-binding domain-containing radical SAM protein [Microthrixaceae bacterium]